MSDMYVLLMGFNPMLLRENNYIQRSNDINNISKKYAVQNCFISFEIYNLHGQKVARLVDEKKNSGYHHV